MLLQVEMSEFSTVFWLIIDDTACHIVGSINQEGGSVAVMGYPPPPNTPLVLLDQYLHPLQVRSIYDPILYVLQIGIRGYGGGSGLYPYLYPTQANLKVEKVALLIV